MSGKMLKKMYGVKADAGGGSKPVTNISSNANANSGPGPSWATKNRQRFEKICDSHFFSQNKSDNFEAQDGPWFLANSSTGSSSKASKNKKSAAKIFSSGAPRQRMRPKNMEMFLAQIQ